MAKHKGCRDQATALWFSTGPWTTEPAEGRRRFNLRSDRSTAPVATDLGRSRLTRSPWNLVVGSLVDLMVRL